MLTLSLRRASGCLGTSRGSSSTTSPMPRVRVPRDVAWLAVNYVAYAARLGASACRAAHHTARRRLLRLCRASGSLGTSRDSSRGLSRDSSSTTSPTLRIRVPRHIAWLVVWLIVDYFASRRLVHRVSGCLGSSRGSSRRSSSTTSPTQCVRVPRHVARLVVDYFAYASRPGARHVAWLIVWLVTQLIVPLVVDYFAYAARPRASARRSARRLLLRLRRASGCLDTSCGSSRGSSRGLSCRSSSTTSPMPRVRVPRHVAWLAVDYFAYAVCSGAPTRHAACHAARR
jgi:hypothetical protein